MNILFDTRKLKKEFIEELKSFNLYDDFINRLHNNYNDRITKNISMNESVKIQMEKRKGKKLHITWSKKGFFIKGDLHIK